MENEDYKKSNREKTQTTKSKTHRWCAYCDRDIVTSGRKCGVCGKVEKTKQLKNMP